MQGGDGGEPAVTKRYTIFADYRQFYLWDHRAGADTAIGYTVEDVARRIVAAPNLVVIQPERNMDVPVELEIVDAAPPIVLDGWDHVAEASLDLPSGMLEIHECTGESVDIIPLAPGTYRVRSHHAGLDTPSDDGLDGDDRYRLVLWPAPSMPVAVLKQYTPA